MPLSKHRIFTKDGIIPLHDLTLNHSTFNSNGNLVQFEPIQTVDVDDCYEVEYSNGEKIIYAFNEEIKINTRTIKNKSTRADDLYKLRSENPKLVIYKDVNKKFNLPKLKDIIINHYALGAWLGDGDKDKFRITGNKEDLDLIYEKVDLPIATKYHVQGGKNWRYSSRKLLPEMRKLNILNNKHIPKQYLFGSYEQRLNLLSGLLDTDGYCYEASGVCEFYQLKNQLLEDFKLLLVSLGIKFTIRYRVNEELGHTYGTFSFIPPQQVNINLFEVKRKHDNLAYIFKPRSVRNYIKNIVPVNNKTISYIDEEVIITSSGNMFI